MRRFVVLLSVLGVVALATAPSAAAQAVVLRPPVDAPVLDPYRPPEHGYGAGNRGIEYDTGPGHGVDAAGPGVVVFAGPVAGRTWVTIVHDGGLLTTYGPLATIAVESGDTVVRGAHVGTTSGPLHFSTRIDGQYVDPATLLGVREVSVRLVPHDNDDQQHWLRLVERDEQRHLASLYGSGGGGFWGVVDRALGFALAAISPAFIGGGSLTEQIEGLVHLGDVVATLHGELDMRAAIGRMVVGLGRILDPEECTPVGVAASLSALPSRRRIAIVIDGLDSASDEDGAMASLDLASLGYGAADVGRVSYNGGLVPGTGGDWPVERTHYGSEATRGDVEAQIEHVAATLRSVAAANPGVPIDVYGHSLGGLVARHAIAATADDVAYGVAITLASPHSGAPLADLVEAVELTTPGSRVADLATDHGWHDMALVAPVIEDLSATGFAGDTSDVAFPDGVHAVTIGARSDVVVPASRAGAPGARHVVVGGFDPFDAHGGIAASPEVEREVRLALAGLPPTCSGVTDAVFDLVVPESISAAQSALAAGLLVTDFVPS